MRWAAADAPVGVGLWLTHLGGSAKQTLPMLTQLASRDLLSVTHCNCVSISIERFAVFTG
jgi:hypothetical protein